MQSNPINHLDYSRLRKNRFRRTIVLCLMLLIYPASYATLRLTHVIVHFQDMEGDVVAPSMTHNLPGLFVFKPLMRIEGMFWDRGNRKPR